MDKTISESIEKQQLVIAGDEDEEAKAGLSPTACAALLSGGSSNLASRTHQGRHIIPNPSGSTRLAHVSERRPTRPPRQISSSTMGMTGGDARKTQAALLRLLATFRAPPPSPAGPGSLPPALAHMVDIREQQDNLARLHFKLGSDPDAPAKPASARETMAKLVKSLEQLSTSIEQLHHTTDCNSEITDSFDENDLSPK